MSQQDHFLSSDQLEASDRFILFHDARIVVQGERFLWSHDQVCDHLDQATSLILLERSADSAVVAVNLQQDISAPLKAELNSLRSLLFFSDQRDFALAGRASQLIDWYRSHKFCGTCGSPTVQHPNERALVCPNCALHFFPRISPCAIMLVTKGEKMLLAKSSRYAAKFYSCLAGFIEIGETPEETVAREVMEEVNLQVKNIRYISSQSWPFPSQLMLGFLAEYAAGEIVPDPTEIEDAQWYDIDDLPTVPSQDISVAGKLIHTFINEVRKARSV